MAASKLSERSAARLAAVQALYQMDIAATSLPDILAEFETHRLGVRRMRAEDEQVLPPELVPQTAETTRRRGAGGIVRMRRCDQHGLAADA